MTKTVAFLSATLMTVALVGGCVSVEKPIDTPISYDGTGDVTEYHPNGKIKRKAVYLNGELVSVVRFYPSGTEESNEQYTLGEIHDATYYFASGRVKTKISGN